MASKARKGKRKEQGLTEEQRQEIREAFDLFDTDGSGKLQFLLTKAVGCKYLRMYSINRIHITEPLFVRLKN